MSAHKTVPLQCLLPLFFIPGYSLLLYSHLDKKEDMWKTLDTAETWSHMEQSKTNLLGIFITGTELIIETNEDMHLNDSS